MLFRSQYRQCRTYMQLVCHIRILDGNNKIGKAEWSRMKIERSFGTLWMGTKYFILKKLGQKWSFHSRRPKKRFMHIQIEIQNDLERFLAKSKYLYNILSYVGMSVRVTCFSQRLQVTWRARGHLKHQTYRDMQFVIKHLVNTNKQKTFYRAR